MTRNFQVTIRLSAEERAFLESAAHVHGLPLASYLRSSAILKTHGDIAAAIERGRVQYAIEREVARSAHEVAE